MIDFFETVRQFYHGTRFCDLDVVSYKFDETNLSERVQCHSIVLSSAIPNFQNIFDAENLTSQDPLTVVIVVDSAGNNFSISETINQVYDAFAGHCSPSLDEWSNALLGNWPQLDTFTKVEEPGRQRTESKRHLIFDDIDSDVKQQVIKSRHKRSTNRKATKRVRAENPSKIYLSSEESFKIVDAGEEEEEDNFMKHFKDSIKEEEYENYDNPESVSYTDADEVSDLLHIGVKSEKVENFAVLERDPDETCLVNFKESKMEKQGAELQRLVATTRATSKSKKTTTQKVTSTQKTISKTKSRRHLKRGQCPECLEIFATANSTERRQFVVHKLSHFNCDCPNINFSSATAFRTHMTSVHSDKKGLSLSCSFGKCHALFFSQGALDHHVRLRHSNSLENGVGRICDECGQTFVNRHHLNIHTRHRHAQIQCTSCEEICVGKLQYNKHIEKFHTRPELCDYCGKSFPSKKFLRIHVINLHMGDCDRPNKCELCGKGFLSKILLRDHISVVHEHQKPYECRASPCDRAFTTSACRRRHELRVHQLNIALKRGAISKYAIPEIGKKSDGQTI